MTHTPEALFSVVETEPPPRNYALVMSGQGNVAKQAGLYEYQASDAFAASFDRSEEFYAKLFPGFSLKRLCFEDPENSLSQTRNTHRAITAIYLAKYEMFRDQNPDHPEPQFISGQSAGEIAAFAIAGMIDQETALYLADKRGEFTEDAGRKNPGSMTSFLYRKDDEGEADLQKTIDKINPEGDRGVLVIANFNSPREYVASGNTELIEELEKEANAYKLTRLDISFASHCPLMEEAVVRMEQELSEIPFDKPKNRLVSNGEISTNPSELKSQHAQGIALPTNWYASTRTIQNGGVDGLVELSSHPMNKAPLSKFAGRVNKDLVSFSI